MKKELPIATYISNDKLLRKRDTQMSTPFKGELHREVYVNPQMIVEMKEA